MKRGLPLHVLCVLACAAALAAACAEEKTPEQLEAERQKPIEASNFNDIVENMGYLLGGVDRVVWVLDQSPSMEDDIAEVRTRMDDWFKNLDPGVQVGVIAFSQKPLLLQPLTKDRAAIKKAFENYKTRESGLENVYSAIGEALKMLQGTKTASAIVIATDEAGDDDKFLAATLQACKTLPVQVYVISPQATFINKIWKWSEDDRVKQSTKFYQSCNGPESYTTEGLYSMHFVQRTYWHAHDYPRNMRQWAIKSGWAPFGLQVLSQATSGRIYELKTDTFFRELVMDEKKRPRYAPDFDTPNLLRNIQRTPWRLALQQVSEYWTKNFKDIERVCPGAGQKSLVSACSRQVPTIQANMKVAETVLEQMAAALKNKAGMRSTDESADSLPHLRWRANLELAYASASVARFHLNQYLADLARFKDPQYVPPGPATGVYGYTIQVHSDANLNPADLPTADADGFREMLAVAPHAPAKTLEQMRKQAETALDVVIANHADTPWAAMATLLKVGMGKYEPEVIMIGPWSHSSGSK
ncbi:MAG: VWA domain-containing protein [Planctomycetota bacterium]|nr:VWA domain-containing protein [Planctomycetota bacterium]